MGSACRNVCVYTICSRLVEKNYRYVSVSWEAKNNTRLTLSSVSFMTTSGSNIEIECSAVRCVYNVPSIHAVSISKQDPPSDSAATTHALSDWSGHASITH